MSPQTKRLVSLLAVVPTAVILLIAFREKALFLQESAHPNASKHEIAPSSESARGNTEVLSNGEFVRTHEPGSIKFPDGESMQIGLRQVPTLDPEGSIVEALDNGTDPGFYEILKPLAEAGNAAAALRLAQALVACLGVPETPKGLATTIDQLHQTRTVPITGPAARQFGVTEDVYIADDANPFEYENELKAQYRRCQGVSEEMKAEADAWLEKSAEFGSISGMLGLAEEIKSSDPLQAKSIYEVLWNKGYVGAAGDLARLLETGGRGLEPDPIAAYAYGYIYLELFRLSRDGTGKSDSDALRRLWEKGLAVRQRRERLLMPTELQQASVLARNLIESNGSCCYHLFSDSRRQMIINQGNTSPESAP